MNKINMTGVKSSTITNIHVATAFLFAGLAALAAAAAIAAKPAPALQDLLNQCKDRNCTTAITKCNKTRKCADTLTACISTSVKEKCGFQSLEKAYACEDAVRVDCSAKVLGAPLNFKKKVVPVMTCIDSDGADFFHPTITTAPNQPKGVLDYCGSAGGKEYLMEGICADNEYVYQQKNCAELGNFACNKGACVPEPAVCGDGMVSKGEACDDGNTIANDTCSVTCKTVTVPVAIIKDCSTKNKEVTVISTEVTVFGTGGVPLPDAQVTVFQLAGSNKSVPKFPFEPFADSDIIAIGKTDASGVYMFSGKNLINQNEYMVQANHPGYVGRFRHGNNCGMMAEKMTLSLTPIDKYSFITPESKKLLAPVRVLSRFVNWSRYEVAGRPIIFPYVPIVRDDIKATAKQVDITLKAVVSQPPASSIIGLTPQPDLAFQYEQTVENVKLDEMQTFEFSLPGGIYYFYFIFTIHDAAGSVTTYNYYPYRFQYGWDTLNKGPNSIPDALLDITSEYDATLFVYPQFTDSQFEPFPLAQNNAQKKRVNVIFINVGFDENTFTDMVSYAFKEGADSLLNTEPLKSNTDRFNFWYYKPSLTLEDAKWQFGNTSQIYLGKEDLTKIQKMYLSNNFNGKTIFYALVNDDSLTAVQTNAGSGKCKFNKGVVFGIASVPFKECLATESKSSCFEKFNIDRIVTHEFGHELGTLGEEYRGNGGLFNINKFMGTSHRLYTPSLQKNVFFSESLPLETSCLQSLYSLGAFPFNYFGGEFLCNNPPIDACVGAPWADLIGNGCGKDGKIDCGPNDPNYTSEVGCYFGAGVGGGSQSYSNILKPTRISIMDYGGKYLYYKSKNTDQSRKFGLANERTLCRAIQTYTGDAGGVCDQLCLAGCNTGERCVQGMCVPAAAVD